jgi:hypothetical protein
MATTTIPKVTLAVGAHPLPNGGGVSIADGLTQAVITIDRTATPSGLNSLTSSSVLEIDIEQSNDGGTTWDQLTDVTVPGGVIVIHGQQQNVAGVGVMFAPGTSRMVRSVVTVSGPSSITVQGTLVTS